MSEQAAESEVGRVLRIAHAAIDTAAAQGFLSHEERAEVTDELVAFGEWNSRAHDATERAALRKVRDEMERQFVPTETIVGDPFVAARISQVRDWLAALDVILKERE